jgi:hypothetical protein
MVAPAGVYFRTSRSQRNDDVLPVYALSGAAGLLGVVCDLLEIADLAPASGAGIAFLVPGGLFELAFPLLLIVRSSSGRSDARLVPVSVGGPVSRDGPEITHVGAGHGIGRSGPQG